MTARSIKSEIRKPKNLRLRPSLFSVALFFLLPVTGISSTLIDTTIATVGQSAITLREVQNYQLFKRLADKRRTKTTSEGSELDQARDALIQQTLIKNYLVSTGLLHPITPAELKEARKDVEYEKNKTLFQEQGVDETSFDLILADWMHERMFFEKLLPSRVTITEKDLRAYYEEKKDSRFLGKPFASVETIVRADLKRDRVEKEFTRWRESEKRRTEIILLPPPEKRTTAAP